MQSKIANLITDDDFEKIELALKEPNIFSALSVHRMEIRHSNFIGYLLNPNENHGLRDLVLKKILRDLFNSSNNNNRRIIDADYINYSNVEIRREWRNIDLLIILEEDIVVIENKIDSRDHTNQLNRYIDIVENNFGHIKNKHYVYLTPFGDDPTDEESRRYYINYSYENISKIIESILNLYKNSLSEKVYFYISDYQTILKREILMSEKLNEDARKVYIKHKAAIDFIYENAPNPVNEIVFPTLQKELTSMGYMIAQRSPRIFRFTTHDINNLLPNKGTGWKDKEDFLFELTLNENNIKFSCVISPGDEVVRSALVNTLKDNFKQSSSKNYLQFGIEKFNFVNLENIDQEQGEVELRLSGILDSIRPTVNKVSELINNSEIIKKALNTQQ